MNDEERMRKEKKLAAFREDAKKFLHDPRLIRYLMRWADKAISSSAGAAKGGGRDKTRWGIYAATLQLLEENPGATARQLWQAFPIGDKHPLTVQTKKELWEVYREIEFRKGCQVEYLVQHPVGFDRQDPLSFSTWKNRYLPKARSEVK